MQGAQQLGGRTAGKGAMIGTTIPGTIRGISWESARSLRARAHTTVVGDMRPASPPPPQKQPPQTQTQPQTQPYPNGTQSAAASAAAASAAPAPPVGDPRPPLSGQGPAQAVVMILGGGRGDGLRPLTDARAEPAVPFAGLFRLVDVPVSNAINSGLDNIYVLAQFNATSLNRHLSRAYSFVNGNLFTSSHDRAFVETLNATQSPGSVTQDAWYAGTADAVRRYLGYLEANEGWEDVLILAGDQIYRMDYADLINHHRARGADVTVATTPADGDHAAHLGVLQVDDAMVATRFVEKPDEGTLSAMSLDAGGCAADAFGLCATDLDECPRFVASMGIYVFKKAALVDLLSRRFPAAADFGRGVLPAVVGEGKVVAYPHSTYWEDVGTLRNYFNSQIALARGTLKLQLFDKERPIFTEPRTLPPSKLFRSKVSSTLLGDGCRVVGSRLDGCVVGSCTYLEGCDLEDVVIFGADEFESAAARASDLARGAVPLGVGEGSVLRRAVVDRNARIGKGVRLVNAAGVREAGGGGGGGGMPEGVVVRDGIIVVKRDAVVPDGTVV